MSTPPRGGSPPWTRVTHELVEEVLRTALALEDVMTALLEELPEGAFPGEDNARVLLEMVVGSVHPGGPRRRRPRLRTATALVGAIRERVLADLRAAADLAESADEGLPPLAPHAPPAPRPRRNTPADHQEILKSEVLR